MADVAKGSRKSRRREKSRRNARRPEAAVPQQEPFIKSCAAAALTRGAGAVIVVIAGTLSWFKP
jgi:hypothetical protein